MWMSLDISGTALGAMLMQRSFPKLPRSHYHPVFYLEELFQDCEHVFGLSREVAYG